MMLPGLNMNAGGLDFQTIVQTVMATVVIAHPVILSTVPRKRTINRSKRASMPPITQLSPSCE
jgi:hypothetical protein